MTPLEAQLVRRIAATGPISMAQYMADCLMHPELGYYTTAQVFGAGGDFTTAPEISQMFGELIGLCLAQSWLDQATPTGSVLAELGPGRGTLMADLLRATAGVPGFAEAMSLHLVEASPQLREVQRTAVAPRIATWHDRVADLPEAPLYLIANEFLDALPVRQFERQTDGWSERMVCLADDRLAQRLSAPCRVPELDPRLTDTVPGDVVELCPALPAIVGEIARRVAAHGGVAIFIDYGDWRSRGDTMQAVRGHAAVPILDMPGQSDLTAHVDFEAVAMAAVAQGAAVTGLTPQGALLERLGIDARAEALARAFSARPGAEEGLQNHLAAYRRLTDPQEMGSLFKAIAIHPQVSPPPPGFRP